IFKLTPAVVDIVDIKSTIHIAYLQADSVGGLDQELTGMGIFGIECYAYQLQSFNSVAAAELGADHIGEAAVLINGEILSVFAVDQRDGNIALVIFRNALAGLTVVLVKVGADTGIAIGCP